MSRPQNLVGSWEGGLAIVAGGGLGGRPGTPLLIMVSIVQRFAAQTLRETPEAFDLVFSGISPDWQWLKGDKHIRLGMPVLEAQQR